MPGVYAQDRQISDGAHIEAAATDVQVGGTDTLIQHIRDGNTLWSETLGHADLPAAAHHRSRRGQLGHDPAFGDIGAVVLTLDRHGQSQWDGCPLRFRGRQADQLRDRDHTPVYGKTHGGHGRDHGHDQQHQRQQQEAEEGFHVPG